MASDYTGCLHILITAEKDITVNPFHESHLNLRYIIWSQWFSVGFDFVVELTCLKIVNSLTLSLQSKCHSCNIHCTSDILICVLIATYSLFTVVATEWPVCLVSSQS